MKSQINKMKRLFKHKEFVIFMLIGILTSIYSSCEAFIPFLAEEIGLNYQEILTSFAFITIINVIISLFVGDISDRHDKKYLYLFDIGSDLVPVVIYAFTKNIPLFYAAIVLSSLKDIFAPSTFAYKYEIFGNYEDDLSKIAVAFLESLTNLFCFMMPTVIGYLWGYIGSKVFMIATIAIIASVLTGFMLPSSKNNLTNV